MKNVGVIVAIVEKFKKAPWVSGLSLVFMFFYYININQEILNFLGEDIKTFLIGFGDLIRGPLLSAATILAAQSLVVEDAKIVEKVKEVVEEKKDEIIPQVENVKIVRSDPPKPARKRTAKKTPAKKISKPRKKTK